MKMKVLLFGIIIGLISFSCGIKPISWQKESNIAVMADKGDWDALGPSLSRVFERVIRTPQKEKTYLLHYVEDKDFDRYTKYRYLILAATLKSQGRIGKLVKRVVADPQIRAEVERGERYLIIQKDQWAADQLMIILVGKDQHSLEETIDANSNTIFHAIDDVVHERMKQEMYKRGEQTKEEDRLMRTYNWSIRIQHDYFIPQELPAEGFLWFRRILPERWIFVRWIDGGNTSLLNQDWVVGERNRIGATYYGGDRVTDKYLFSYAGEFLGRKAQITTGLWENNEKMKGGPFMNYTFYDEYTKRVYMIDIAAFAPDRDKLPYLKRLDIIAHTFRTVFDMEVK